jgi:hypothetical protein
LDPTSNKIYVSRHVIFDEHTFPAQDKAYLTAPTEDSSHPPGTILLPIDFYSLNATHDSEPHPTLAESSSNSSTPPTTPAATHTQPEIAVISPSIYTDNSIDPEESPTPESVHPSSAEELPRFEPDHPPSFLVELPAPTHHISTRSQTRHSKPKDFSDFHLYHSRHTTKHPWKAMMATSAFEPTTFSKAVFYPSWCAAMASEFVALMDNQTWSLCPRPLDRHVICNKWVYKLK